MLLFVGVFESCLMMFMVFIALFPPDYSRNRRTGCPNFFWPLNFPKLADFQVFCEVFNILIGLFKFRTFNFSAMRDTLLFLSVFCSSRQRQMVSHITFLSRTWGSNLFPVQKSNWMKNVYFFTTFVPSIPFCLCFSITSGVFILTQLFLLMSGLNLTKEYHGL